MCRMLIYKGMGREDGILLSDLIVNPKHSIIQQSYHCLERNESEGGVPSQINADGFGVGWYSHGVLENRFIPVDASKRQRRNTSKARLADSPASTVLPPGKETIPPLSLEPLGTLPLSRSEEKLPSLSLDVPWRKADVGLSVKKRRRSLLNGDEGFEDVWTSPEKGEDSAAKDAKGRSTHRYTETPGVFTSITPAWNNRNLFRLSEKIRSPLVFAHVRAASLGSPAAETNCHPFAYEGFLFMHNGMVGEFNSLKKRLVSFLSEEAFLSIQGNTDSEYCFALVLTELQKIHPNLSSSYFSTMELQRAVHRAIQRLQTWALEMKSSRGEDVPLSLLNFALTNGSSVVTSRFVSSPNHPAASLYFTTGTRWEATSDSSENGNYMMRQLDRRDRVVIVASERLSIHEDWIEIPVNHMLSVSEDLNVLLTPITL